VVAEARRLRQGSFQPPLARPIHPAGARAQTNPGHAVDRRRRCGAGVVGRLARDPAGAADARRWAQAPVRAARHRQPDRAGVPRIAGALRPAGDRPWADDLRAGDDHPGIGRRPAGRLSDEVRGHRSVGSAVAEPVAPAASDPPVLDCRPVAPPERVSASSPRLPLPSLLGANRHRGRAH
jgi:hypothetical protein